MVFRKQFLIFSICILGLSSCNIADKIKGKKGKEQDSARTEPLADTEALSADSKTVDALSKDTPPPGSGATRAEIFRDTLFPLLKDHCSGTSCHNKATSPLIAQEDFSQAWTAAAEKIDFEQASASILVSRLSILSHQCWTTSCAADATTMTTAIQSLHDKLAEAALLPKSTRVQTTPVSFASALTDLNEANESSVVLYAKDSAARSGAFAEKSEKEHFDRDAKIKDYIELPLNNPTATITYSMNVPKTADYFLWVRAKLVDDTRFTTFNVNVNGTASPGVAIGPDQSGWAWYLLPSPNGKQIGNGEIMLGGFFQLSGKVNVVISDIDGEFRINRIALTTQGRDFAGDDVTRPVKILKVPINDLCGGKNVSLRVEVEEFDAKTKAISIRNLRIENTETVSIKGIEVLINGKYSPLNTTFRIVDSEVAPPGKLLTRSALLAIGENGFLADQLSFAVDKCK